jgi:hypothetical protein
MCLVMELDIKEDTLKNEDKAICHLKKPLVLELSTLGKKSSFRKYLFILNENDENESYRSCFKEGADLMPRQAVIVCILGNKKAKVLNVQTSEVEKANPNNKWSIDLKGRIESKFIFTTLKSDVVLPFTAGQYSYVALPVEKSQEGKNRIMG